MSRRVKCFWSEPQTVGEESLRRFTFTSNKSCPGTTHGHDASVPLGRTVYPHDDLNGWGRDDLDHDDPRWPTKCEHCDYLFQPEDTWQHNMERLYANVKTGEQFSLRRPPSGAMWNASWMPEDWGGADGIRLVVALPNGATWNVDGQATNCTRPNEPHKCWIRHGVPPDVTVDKNGDTCAAGGGSILSHNYHGFLREGWLEEC